MNFDNIRKNFLITSKLLTKRKVKALFTILVRDLVEETK